MNIFYIGKNALSTLVNEITNKFATKDIVSTSNPGLVPAPTSADVNKVLSGNCEWRNESVSISSDNTYAPLEE